MVTCPPEPVWQQQLTWRLYIESSQWLITFKHQFTWSPQPYVFLSLLMGFIPFSIHHSLSPLYLSLSVLPSSYPLVLFTVHSSPILNSPSVSLSCPSYYPPLPLSLFLFLCLGSICAALGKICWEKKRGRIERRKTWKMDSAWALHYNGELSQGRFALPLNEASICIYSLPVCFYFSPLWEFSSFL